MQSNSKIVDFRSTNRNQLSRGLHPNAQLRWFYSKNMASELQKVVPSLSGFLQRLSRSVSAFCFLVIHCCSEVEPLYPWCTSFFTPSLLFLRSRSRCETFLFSREKLRCSKYSRAKKASPFSCCLSFVLSVSHPSSFSLFLCLGQRDGCSFLTSFEGKKGKGEEGEGTRGVQRNNKDVSRSGERNEDLKAPRLGDNYREANPYNLLKA